jgi:hypothetical protein
MGNVFIINIDIKNKQMERSPAYNPAEDAFSSKIEDLSPEPKTKDQRSLSRMARYGNVLEPCGINTAAGPG